MASLVKVSDYLVQRLVDWGVRHTFMITGGGAMHLNDSFGRQKKIKLIFNHHEQASAMAAEGYARLKQQLGVVCVTTGPGGLNCLSGLMGAWTDSVPLLFISGQVKTSTMIRACPQLKLRQLGDQEVDIISIVRPLTKFARIIDRPEEIDVVLAQAVTAAISDRPGPVWLDIPLNIQGAMLNPTAIIQGSWPQKLCPAQQHSALPLQTEGLAAVVERLLHAQRPLIVVGHGVRLAHQEEVLTKLIKQVAIPVVTSFNGMDLVPYTHPLTVGRIGTIGQRAANKALQAADVILFLGTRNNIRQVSYDWENFAPQAYKIVLDIDAAELAKPTLRPNLKLNFD
ncbi:MAG: thiamine pyrophosphate-binding protein, partial [Bacteriovoracaceae bacterium]|nr:thiamine pyrophosphate-binding protein [Bacteriovoracaceae bacterium]